MIVRFLRTALGSLLLVPAIVVLLGIFQYSHAEKGNEGLENRLLMAQLTRFEPRPEPSIMGEEKVTAPAVREPSTRATQEHVTVEKEEISPDKKDVPPRVKRPDRATPKKEPTPKTVQPPPGEQPPPPATIPQAIQRPQLELEPSRPREAVTLPDIEQKPSPPGLPARPEPGVVPPPPAVKQPRFGLPPQQKEDVVTEKPEDPQSPVGVQFPPGIPERVPERPRPAGPELEKQPWFGVTPSHGVSGHEAVSDSPGTGVPQPEDVRRIAPVRAELRGIDRKIDIPLVCEGEDAMVFHVSSGAGPGDGSAEAPFPSVQAAVAAAEEARFCALEIHVSDGIYAGAIDITRPTVIVGESRTQTRLMASVRNLSGWKLVLRNLQVRGAQEVGIVQSGGKLVLDHVILWGTRAVPEGLHSAGRGVILKGGVEADLESVEISHSKGQALLVEGHGTRLHASGLSLRNNRVNPALAAALIAEPRHRPDAGALEIRDGATALVEQFTIEGNEFIGVFVHHGGRAHLRSGTVHGTTMKENIGGINLVAWSAGVVELRDFTVEGAALTGLQAVNAILTAEDGQVKGNTIGINLQGDHQPVECVTKNVAFIDNDLNLDSHEVPLQSPVGSLDSLTGGEAETSSAFACERVSWDWEK